MGGPERRVALEEHYAALQHRLDEIAASGPNHLVVLAGDLNAKTGPAQALGPASLAALLAAGLPTQRSHLPHANGTDPDVPGHLLNDICEATDIIIVIDLGYADDAGLCGETPEELQQLIATAITVGRTGCW